MDAQTAFEEPIGPIAEAIAKRIADERKRLVDEEQIEASLTVERKRLLTAGTDAETDACEVRIDASRSAQVRILERVDLLTAQLHEANAAECSAQLDAAEARANAAREEGERLIRIEYSRLAKQMGSLLHRLLVCDRAIARENFTLERNGRTPVVPSNHARYTPMRRLEFAKTVKVTPHDPRHSLHGKVQLNRNSVWCEPSGQPIPLERVSESVTEQRTEVIGADYPTPLYDVVRLPAAEPMPYIHPTLPKKPIPQPFFENTNLRPLEISNEEIDALISELDLTRKSKRKSAQ